ncbi:glycoside hydrolase family 2 protein [Flavobacterium sp.]|uniref:glycoside hydrolase family 2 protein n=1 Tax=Flavobacterium sp. TaxID=239 RepID=UPI0025E3B303|nr:sugar-binding domain-containing protein [Flavobacterium sp.]
METSHRNYGLSKVKEENFNEEVFLNPIPRSVLRPNAFIILDGEWRFSEDHDGSGLLDKWYNGHEYTDTAAWPGSIEDHITKVHGAAADRVWHDKIVVWYERDFPLPHAEKGESLKEMLQLTFGACGYETRVWLNGFPLETIEGEEVHQGAYTSFSYELDAIKLRPVNRLTVRIADTMDPDTPRGKQESHVYKRGGIWYQTYSGAVRSVWLETVERNRLRSRVGAISFIEDNLVRFNFTTRIHDPGTYTLKLKIYPKEGDRQLLLAADEYILNLDVGQKGQRIVIQIPNGELWSPDHPYLYKLVAQLVDSNGHIAEIETVFGMRKIESRGSRIYLNNNPLYLDGILYQPGTATYEEIKLHMKAMKALGCNLVRIHISGVDPRIYNLADKIGILLCEVPSTHQSNDISRENHKGELLRMLALLGTHPSIAIWSLYNEDWGAQDIATSPETRLYIINLYNYMHITYPQFLVVDNDGWQHISFEGKLKSDLLTVHLYTPDIEHWRNLLDGLCEGQLNGVAAFPLVVGDPFFYRSQVPLLVSEWGGFGFENYGGPEGDSERTRLIGLFKKELRRRPIAGDIYTQATNIEDEKNGIINAETGELNVSPGLLKS